MSLTNADFVYCSKAGLSDIMDDFSGYNDFPAAVPSSFYTSSQIYSPQSSHRQRSLPDLPLSPIKKVDRSRTERNTMGAIENRRSTFTRNSTVSSKTPEEQYFNFRQRLQESFQAGEENSSLRADDVNGKELYDRVVQLRQYIRHGKRSHRKERSTVYSTFRAPTPSFQLSNETQRNVDHTIEAPRNNSNTIKSASVPASNLLEELLDVNLKSFENIAVSTDALNYSTKAVETTPGLKSRSKQLPGRPSSCVNLSEVNPSSHLTPTRLSFSPQRRIQEDINGNTRPSRSEVKKLVRDLFCDVDAIPKKGGLKNSRQHQNSETVRTLIHGPRSVSQPRVLSRSLNEPSAKLSTKQTIVKSPPFCSSVSNTDYSQAVHANEQQLIKLVNTHFPHWRTYVRNLLADRNVENDVAINFLEEIENRRLSKELSTKIHRDERIDEFNHTDEKILNKLREKLCRGQASRIHQLRILQQVLRESC